jgi:acyl-CoA reductase-like NAD-dependent aldehyde dehydrogenase
MLAVRVKVEKRWNAVPPKTHPYYLANRPESPNADLDVIDKFSGEVAARVALAGPEAFERAIAAAAGAAPAMAAIPAWRRQAVLNHCADRFAERAEELAQTLCVEAGKPIVHARGEVGRLIDTFRIAAEEAVRAGGEVMPMDRTERNERYLGFIRRVPVGPVALISPFNFPLNLVAHKVAPAIAAGCPFVLKPSERTPLGALIIGQTLAECELPAGAFSILPAPPDNAGALVEDDRLKLLSFTGSTAVGWQLKARAGRKKVLLELGGNAGCIVDESGVDLEDAVRRLVFGAFYQSGQSCISVQRIVVHESIYKEFREKFVSAARALKAGDPRHESTFIGPLIDDAAADRIEEWIHEARAAGAKVLCGGGRNGRMVEATVLEGVGRRCRICREEAFAPVAVLSKFRAFDAALDEINDSEYGLQAGVFTRDLHRARRAWDRLAVGGVIVNDAPAWRADHMPYGGVKASGLGREGLRWAIEEMTEPRLMAIRTPPGE